MSETSRSNRPGNLNTDKYYAASGTSAIRRRAGGDFRGMPGEPMPKPKPMVFEPGDTNTGKYYESGYKQTKKTNKPVATQQSQPLALSLLGKPAGHTVLEVADISETMSTVIADAKTNVFKPVYVTPDLAERFKTQLELAVARGQLTPAQFPEVRLQVAAWTVPARAPVAVPRTPVADEAPLPLPAAKPPTPAKVTENAVVAESKTASVVKPAKPKTVKPPAAPQVFATSEADSDN